MNIGQNMMFMNYLFDGVYLVDKNHTILFWNTGAEEITGYKASEMIGSKCNDKLLLHFNNSDDSRCTNTCPFEQVLQSDQPIERSFYLQHKDGNKISVMVRVIPIIDDLGVHQFTMETFTKNNCVGNTEHVMALARKAFIDSRSGLPNKEYMDNKLRSLLASGGFGASNILGLFFIHLDNLREINDDYGIQAGDMTVKRIGKILSENIQPDDIIGRLDGGLFLIITHLDKKFLMINWANKLKSLIQNSGVSGYENIAMNVCISGFIASVGETLDKVYHILDEELKISRDLPMNVSIRDFTPSK